MEIVLYQYSGARERVDKTSYLVEVETLSGTLRDDTDLLNPTIIVELTKSTPNLVTESGDPVATAGGESVIIPIEEITSANYAYIRDFNRYYFINAIEVTTASKTGKRLYRLSMSVDVLQSFKNQILELNCYIARNQFVYDPLLEDSSYPFKDRKFVSEYVPSSGSLVNTSFGVAGGYPRNIVLNLVSNRIADTGDINPPSGSGLPTIDPRYFVSYRSSTPYAIDYSTFGKIATQLMGATYGEKISFVKSVVAFPFNPAPDALGSQYIYFGDSSDNNNRMSDPEIAGDYIQGSLSRYFSRYLVVADFVIPSPSNFYDFSPWSHYEIYLPYLGWKEFDYQLLAGNRVIVYYTANYEDGSGDVYVYDFTNKRLLFSSSCQLGVKLAFSSTNAQQIADQRNALGLNLGLGLIASAVNVGGGIATANPLGAVKGIVGGASAIADFTKANEQLYSHAQSSFSGSAGGLFAPQSVKIRVTSPVPTFSSESKFRALYGRPLRDFRTLRDLQGITYVGDLHLDGFDCLTPEKDQIENLLQNGVIL